MIVYFNGDQPPLEIPRGHVSSIHENSYVVKTVTESYYIPMNSVLYIVK